ncbi:choline ABC transporter substrate-binding protein [Pseudomonas sp. 2FG]|uniref:choline ABC transporter substrate-binding protein n=1 Tax=Pseudomonas sp. 2FG TaxID=2502191 RepID=UPI0010F74491|nr:choline ABC transporter substrate-binding protein [Pseudomonas sp. 2FG]
MKCFTSLCLALSLSSPVLASAAEADSCKRVRFADVGWTDITMTTAVTRLLLGSLGYVTSVKRMSVPQTYKALEDNKLDVFLGNWMPSMEGDIRPYLDKGSVETLRANLQGAKYTLAVPEYVYEGGLKSFDDIAKFKDQLDGKIYGIEPGNDGNQLISKMIKEDTYGLGSFKLVESNEAKMLASVERAAHLKQWLVFLGWEPHPMNTRNKMRYLEGGDAVFGPDYGGATVYTNVRKGYSQECGNVGQLLNNLVFALPMENQLMDAVLNQSQNPRQAAKAWLQTNPQVLDAWLRGVSSRDGQPALAVVKAKLELAQ